MVQVQPEINTKECVLRDQNEEQLPILAKLHLVLDHPLHWKLVGTKLTIKQVDMLTDGIYQRADLTSVGKLDLWLYNL